ncbi:MAG TPA: SurA N-terminal domain-containing protein [Candidatus Eisenbacteria bacterium]|jgi:peptidyl-prolyl cis-trans isomerase D
MLRFLRGATHHTKTIWWVLIFITISGFVLGFVFLLGSGLGSGRGGRGTNFAGTVNGERILFSEYQAALANQRDAYRRQYKTEPAERDEKMIELQAWRNLVIEKLLGQQAKALGIRPRDREVVLTLKTSPPAQLVNQPVFQTDGKFDPAKYQQALNDPKINWAGFEEIVRQQLPVRKLQERLLAAIKLSEPELREAFHDRYDRATVTVVQVPAAPDSGTPAPAEADLDRAYQRYRGRFATDERVQLEVLIVPERIGEEEQRVARELAQSLATRARGGEDFAALCKDYSEGPNAEQGGVVDRYFQPGELGGEAGAKIAALNAGEVSDAFLDGTRYMVVKLMDKKQATPGAPPSLKIAQIAIKVRPNENTLRDQVEELKKLRERATRIGLGRAAAERGLATARTEWYDYDRSPQSLFGVPEAGDWGLTARPNEVSPVFVGLDELAVAQLAARRAAGIPPREEITDELRQFARADLRVERSKPAADVVEKALASGGTLEQAARAAGLTAAKVEGLTRVRPDPRISGAPEMVGALFAAPAGKVLGPVRGLNGWYFGRLDQLVPADSASFTALKGQLSNEILQRRQQSFLLGYLASVRGKAKVTDLRQGPAGD